MPFNFEEPNMNRIFWERCSRLGQHLLLGFLGSITIAPAILAQQASTTATVASDDMVAAAESRSANLVKAFESAKVDEVAKLFSEDAEFVDEQGNIYQGKKEIEALFTSFFEKFPGAKLTTTVDSVRPIGSAMLVEEGTRTITVADASNSASLRYLMVLTKQANEWKISLVREFTVDTPPAQLDYLMPLSLLEGEWIDENPSGSTRVHYHWNEEKTFLLGEYTVQVNGRPAMKSSQRLGWDPVQQKIRSWTFDADGGFSEGYWTPTESGWIVNSTATLPSGEIGTATLSVTLLDDDRITVSSRDRVIGNVVEEPFEIQIVRRPPAPKK